MCKKTVHQENGLLFGADKSNLLTMQSNSILLNFKNVTGYVITIYNMRGETIYNMRVKSAVDTKWLESAKSEEKKHSRFLRQGAQSPGFFSSRSLSLYICTHCQTHTTRSEAMYTPWPLGVDVRVWGRPLYQRHRVGGGVHNGKLHRREQRIPALSALSLHFPPVEIKLL